MAETCNDLRGRRFLVLNYPVLRVGETGHGAASRKNFLFGKESLELSTPEPRAFLQLEGYFCYYNISLTSKVRSLSSAWY